MLKIQLSLALVLMKFIFVVLFMYAGVQSVGTGVAPGAVHVDSRAVEAVSGFACLGSGVGSGSCSCPEMRRRLGVAGSIVARLDRVWRRRRLGLSARLGIYSTPLLCSRWCCVVLGRGQCAK